ncbi:hypothetical protein QBC42DRAFT_263941 [Cladorrhinum samala]|uniref:Uncharacterized protein n=1 Tax=Cladorrhinum samala TaxID=585594 RepID=A0AAV9HTV8_9PEZI|nr:hypothetical protein QBC42DRAFT_263941 [Cladorrhinum samala]
MHPCFIYSIKQVTTLPIGPQMPRYAQVISHEPSCRERIKVKFKRHCTQLVGWVSDFFFFLSNFFLPLFPTVLPLIIASSLPLLYFFIFYFFTVLYTLFIIRRISLFYFFSLLKPTRQ